MSFLAGRRRLRGRWGVEDGLRLRRASRRACLARDLVRLREGGLEMRWGVGREEEEWWGLLADLGFVGGRGA